jgi:tetratricopeptide (TPR) repeat protein
LGSLAEAKSDWRSAVSYYKQARAAVPQEPETHAILALALSKMERYAEAVAVQVQLVEMTPDDLQARLILGELRFKSGDEKLAMEAYAAYELRRKGLLDGLTLKKDGAYVASEADRAAIASHLAPASDNGTALALLYALQSDPAAPVCDAIVEVMGMQRLRGYKEGIEAYGTRAQSEESKKLVAWALAEIERDAVDVRPGGAPWLPEVEATESGGAEAAPAGDSSGGVKPAPAPTGG